MIAVPEKYALEVNAPVPIASERQHDVFVNLIWPTLILSFGPP